MYILKLLKNYMVVKHEKQSEPKAVEVPASEATEEVVEEKPKRGRKPKKQTDEE